MTLPFWKFARSRLAKGDPVFLAHVAHNTRHSPGTRGAQLAVTTGGATFGTIGGGIMEAQVLEIAQKAFQTGDFSPRYEQLVHRRKAPKGENSRTSGLICAGTQTNVYHLLEADRDLAALTTIIDTLEADAPGLITIDAGGLSVDLATPDPAASPYHFEGGQTWRFSRQLLNWKRVAIIGGGHCGLALSRVMSQLGYAVTIFENRPDVFTFLENQFATRKVVVDDYQEAAAHIVHPRWTHVVVMTANQPDDLRALLGITEHSFPYIGVMGAPAKLTKIRRELVEADVSREAVDAFYAPIGLPMTSNTPEEIAISIAGEILRERQKLFPFARPPAN